MAQGAHNHKAANLWVSRIIPLILIGIVGYVTWVFVVLLCVNYLLKPPASLHVPRPEAAIAILVLYSVLLLTIAVSYFRLLYIVTANPGYVPRAPQWLAKQARKSDAKTRRKSVHGNRDCQDSTEEVEGGPASKNDVDGTFAGGAYTEGAFHAPTTTESAPGLQDFYSKDVFVCQGDGRPIWCSTCENWKPDRSHHCREIERCVQKMDHFCPWVGGVVSETSFKFFVQFVAWTAVYCIFNLVVMAYFVAEYRRKTHTFDVHWLVTLCLGALFGLFTVGMTGSSLQFAIINSTTIENLSRMSTVWTLAIYMPRAPEISSGFRTISFSPTKTLPSSAATTNTEQDQSNDIRTFAILHTRPGENPFDLGPYQNFKSVMGDKWYHWFLPFRYSPCCNHERQDGQFAMGPVVQRMRQEAGIALPEGVSDEKPRKKRKRRRRQRYQSDAAGPGQIETEKMHVPNENGSPDTGHDRDEIDLESGLGHTNGTVQ